jgi:methionyl-tRNA synthetase
MADNKDFAIDDLSSALRSHVILSTTKKAAPPPKPAVPVVEPPPPKAEAAPKKEKAAPKKKENAATATAATATKKQQKPYDRWNLQDDASIDYGYLPKTKGAGIGSTHDKSYYITTAINYTNGPAHMGHAYEAATADVIARFQRLKSSDQAAYFVTGADEHGQKIANTAADEGKEPIEICDKVSV